MNNDVYNDKYDCAQQIAGYNYPLATKQCLNLHGCVNIVRSCSLCPVVADAKDELTFSERDCKYSMEIKFSFVITNL